MEPQLRSESLPDPPSGWLSRTAVAFIVLTLIALVLVPWVVQRRVDALRAEIEASEPARTLVNQWQYSLVREMAALSELLLSGDTGQTRTYAMAWAQERAIYTRLAPLVERMGPAVVAHFVEARTLALQWHDRVSQDELARSRAAGAPVLQIPRERQLFEDVLRAVAAMDSAIVSATAETRARIVDAERAGLRWSLLLGMLALIAALAAFVLHARVRRFADEAERRRAESAAALAETARASDQRNRLLRGISHDVKNPLGAARGYAELLAMGVKAPLADGQAPLVAGIERSIDSALAIIADLLDLARVDSNSLSVNRRRVDLNGVVRDAVEDYRASADTSGHTLAFDTEGRPLWVHTDPLRVRQVLDNLLSNALKYTPAPGRITVSTALVGSDSERPGEWATVRVSDTGPGIPPEQRESVFDEFTRLDDTSATKGHGLGLAIARGLARRLGGDLTLADSDRGATFVLWIPQRERDGTTESESESVRDFAHVVIVGLTMAALTACTGDPSGPRPPATALRYDALTAGYYHTCALTFAGTALCWGGNGAGALGDGTRTAHSTPMPVSGGHKFQAIDAGAGHTCALSDGGAAWCWGQNDEGQAGDGTFTARDAPVAVAGGLTFVDISAGHAHTCAVAEDGAAYCWGDDSRGQLGDGQSDVTKSAEPVLVLHSEPLVNIAAGYYQTCALDMDGAAFCWGASESGQGGSGSLDDSHAPIALHGTLRFSDIAPGDRFVCAVSGGAPWCWGANRNGELGASAPAAGSSTPLEIEDAPRTSHVLASMGTSTVGSAQAYGCLVQASGSAHCWGGTVRALRPAATGVASLDDRISFDDLAAGAQHICGLDRGGYAWCGGANYAGQLGDGTETDRAQLVAVH